MLYKASRMFYTMTLYGRHWKQTETTTEAAGTLWNIVWNLMERDGNLWQLLGIVQFWARLTPTPTHIVTHDPVTSGAEDGRCQSHYT